MESAAQVSFNRATTYVVVRAYIQPERPMIEDNLWQDISIRPAAGAVTRLQLSAVTVAVLDTQKLRNTIHD